MGRGVGRTETAKEDKRTLERTPIWALDRDIEVAEVVFMGRSADSWRRISH